MPPFYYLSSLQFTTLAHPSFISLFVYNSKHSKVNAKGLKMSKVIGLIFFVSVISGIGLELENFASDAIIANAEKIELAANF